MPQTLRKPLNASLWHIPFLQNVRALADLLQQRRLAQQKVQEACSKKELLAAAQRIVQLDELIRKMTDKIIRMDLPTIPPSFRPWAKNEISSHMSKEAEASEAQDSMEEKTALNILRAFPCFYSTR